MKKIKKTMLAFGTLASVVAPITAAVSCGSTDGVDPSILTIVAEKGWSASMTKLIDDFSASEDGKTLMEENGIKSIQIKEAGAFEMADRLNTKGNKDSGVSDIVLLPGDRLKSMMEQNYIKAFKEKDLATFATEEIGAGEIFLNGAIQSAAPGKESDTKFYAVPQNVEAMVAWKDTTTAAADITKHITVASDLWKANGFFNTDAGNLKDIVTVDNEGAASYNEDITGDGGTEAFLKAGFKNLIGGDTAVNGYTAAMLLSKADDASPKIQKHFVDNKGVSSIIAGPWEKSTIEEALGSSGKIEATDTMNYNQWAGGWNFTLNSRMGDAKQNVAEKFIGYILNASNAKDVYEGMDKMSPTTMGSTTLKGALTDTAQVDVTAMYAAADGLKERPTAAEFGVVWGAYADVIQAMGSTIEGVNNADTAEKAAAKFAADFKKAIETALLAA